MEEPNITKGEWKIEEGLGVYSGDRLVANCGGYSSHPHQERIIKENRANAQFISSAPDLLAELIEADRVICELCVRLNPQHANCDWCKDREPRLKALAKAEGK